MAALLDHLEYRQAVMVGLSAGGFAIAGTVYLLGFERYRPVLRASILISFLGYTSVCIGMLYELGLPWRVWHPIVYWNRRSVLFAVSWCVILYTTVLTLEFAPQVIEKLPWKRLRELILHWHHKILIALVLIGVLLSSLHQSFLGGLFLIMKGRIYPLWYSEYLHTMFYMSAIPAGLAVVIMAMYLSMRSLKVKLDYSILVDLAKVIVPMLSLYTIFRFVDLLAHGGAAYMFQARSETAYFWLEIVLLLAAPITLYSMERVRNNPQYLYWTSALLVMGFMTNRMNVSITSLEAYSHANYGPSWSEFAMTMMLVASGVAFFRWAVLHLKIFPRQEARTKWRASSAPTAVANLPCSRCSPA